MAETNNPEGLPAGTSAKKGLPTEATLSGLTKASLPAETQVKAGYNHTKLGWIPEDWGLEEIGGKIGLLSGFAFSSKKYSKEGIRLLRGANIKRGNTDWSDDITIYWDEDIESYSRYQLRSGDLVIAMDGSLVGRSYAFINDGDLPALLLQRVARIRSDEIHIPFLKEYVSSKIFVNYCDSVKTVTAIPHISSKDIRKFKIPLPPLPEQQKIAQILSTWDRAIDKMGQLIAKKQERKKGLMQWLLTGKKRFGEFEGDWVVKSIKDIASVDSQSLGSATPKNYRFRYISLSDVENGRVNKNIPTLEFGQAPSRARRLVNQNSVIMATVRPNLQAFAMVEEKPIDLIASTGFAVLDAKMEVSSRYLFHYLYSYHLTKQIDSLIVGSNYPAINSKEVKNLKVSIPGFEEQQKIASVLSSADQEIEKLQNQLEMFKEQKKGIMQKLLTGEIRVRINKT